MLGRQRRRRRRDADRYRAINLDRSVSSSERPYTITASLGGFDMVAIPWSGTSWEDARDSFLEYLENDAELNDTGGRHRNYRTLYVRFYGRWQLLTFRTDWVPGFTVK